MNWCPKNLHYKQNKETFIIWNLIYLNDINDLFHTKYRPFGVSLDNWKYIHISTHRFDFLLIENPWKRLGLQLKYEIHFQFDFYRMRWWKWRINLLHKLTPLWGRGGRLRYRCRMCWQFEMRPGQWFGWQLRYFPWIYLNKRLLLWP